jgi:integrase
MKLNKSALSSIEIPSGKSEVICFDDGVPGFGLRVRAGGSRNWIFQYRQGGKQRRLSFGSANTVTAQQAREKAAELHARVKLGEDPAGQKIESRTRAIETFGHVLRLSYLKEKRATLRPRSLVEVERHLLSHAKRLHGLQMASVDRHTIAALLTEVATSSGPTEANHVRASLSAFFSWAMCEGRAESNPVIATKRAEEKGPRERVLTDAELQSIWQALAADDYGTIVKLLILTGQRCNEIGGLRWSEVSLDQAMISLPAERVKNGKPHGISLSRPALTLLLQRSEIRGTRECVFGRGATGYQGWHYNKKALDERLLAAGKAITPGWVLHDVRRTVSTRMHDDDLGIAPHIVEAVLNHVGHKAGVAGTYNYAKYAREKARALEIWGDYVLAVVEGRERRKVVPLRSA